MSFADIQGGRNRGLSQKNMMAFAGGKLQPRVQAAPAPGLNGTQVKPRADKMSFQPMS